MVPAVLTLAFFAGPYAAESFNCNNGAISDTVRSTYLDYHNKARRNVAKGIEPNKTGTLNPAKNMYKLVSKAKRF
ncbi:hypothetical protein OESDEN_21678 [Oesophagostomum dentatum]|uniref:SCP domain-containing protein n=1 Tax=Oesophagostomum dentatum TaxID=61180 RepID=A0A0B1S196_OESDE|nr:hypothetical protein OESDEN_21678 [Oesophagostomum dentatum]